MIIKEISSIAKKLKTEGDISKEDLNKVQHVAFPWYYSHYREKKDGRRQALIEWYTAVLESLQKGKTGVFINSIPVYPGWLRGPDEVVDIVFETHSLLSPIDRVFKTAFSKKINIQLSDEDDYFSLSDDEIEYWTGPWELYWAGLLRRSSAYEMSLKKVDVLSGHSGLFSELTNFFSEKQYLIEPYFFPRAVSVKAMSRMDIPFLWAQFYDNKTNSKRISAIETPAVFLVPPVESAVLEKTFCKFCGLIGNHLLEEGLVYREADGTYLYLKYPEKTEELIDYCADLFISEYKEIEVLEAAIRGIEDDDSWMEITR
jgi:hypothetical protein